MLTYLAVQPQKRQGFALSYIEVRGVNKYFTVRKKRSRGALFREKETVHALKDLSLDIEQGELVGYIGPNGAGKSTTVKILSGILTPEEGTVTVGGRVPWVSRKNHVRRIGVVFGQRSQLWWDVPIQDSFSLLRDIYRVPDGAYQKRLGELTEALQLGDLLRTPLRLCSLGQRMRAELCGSLLHSPELLFLDEPTIGLDAVSKLALRDFLRWENGQRGTTILLTTHDMEDITALSSRVMVLGHGRLLYDGAMRDLLARYDTQRTAAVRYETPVELSGLPAGCQVARQGETFLVTYSPQAVAAGEVLERLRLAGPIAELTIQPQSVDHLIARMYREMEL